MRDTQLARLTRAAAPVAVVTGAVMLAQLMSAMGTGSQIPWAVLTKAVIGGLVNALLVVGLVLVYRAARVVNFAQIGFGLIAVMTYLLLRQVWGWSFWLVVPAVVAGAALVGVVVEVAIVRRFASAPRLVLTVVTLSIGLSLAGASLFLPLLFHVNASDPLPPFGPTTPFGAISKPWFPEVFSGEHLMAAAVACGALVLLALFLRVSSTGLAVRGAAENRDRAATLGVNTANLSAVVWGTAASLAAVAALLQAMMSRTSLAQAVSVTGAAAIGAPTMLRMLGAAVIARMERIPVAVAGAIAISILDSAVFWSYRKTSVVDAGVLLIVVIALSVQRRSTARADSAITATWEAAEELRPIPPVLANLPVVRRGVRRFAFTIGFVLLALPWLMSPSQTLQASIMAIYALLTVSLVVLTGWGGQVSLGQFGFAAVGALVGSWLTATVGVPFPIALVVSGVAGACAAVLVGLPALRIQGLFLGVTSLGFAVVAQSVLLNSEYVDFIPNRVTRPVFLGIDMNKDERAFYFLCLAILAVAVLAASALRRSRTGRVLIAMRDNERAAQSFGLNLVRVRLATFAISGAMAAVAGMLFAAHQFGVRQSSYGPEHSIYVFLVAIIGGLGSVWGSLLGAAYLGVATIAIGGLAGQILASSVGVLAVLVLFPGGLGGLACRVRDAWLRRIALRYRIFVPSLLAVDRRAEGDDLVPLADRPNIEPVARRYRVNSVIGSTGSSQTARTWVG